MAKITPEQLASASDAIGRELKRLEGLSAARDTLRDLGSLTAHALEVEARIAEGNRALALCTRDIARAQEDLNRARRQAVDIGKAAAAECDTMRRETREAADRIHADAVANAQRMVEDAQTEASSRINDALAAKSAIDQDVASAKVEVESLHKATTMKQSELAELEAKLVAARLAAARVLADAQTTTTKEPA